MSENLKLKHRFKIGVGAAGDQSGATDVAERLKPSIEKLSTQIDDGGISFLRLPMERSDLLTQQALVDRIRESATDVVVLGTGGSSLGARALYALMQGRASERVPFPRLHFPENLGAFATDSLLDRLDLGVTHFIVVSKSGNTVETLAQFSICLEAARAELVEYELHNHFTVIVDPGDSPLRRMARDFGFSILDHLADLGGRYSVFSLVALLPAMVGGVQVAEFRKGGAKVLQAFCDQSEAEPPISVQGAATTYNLMRGVGIGSHVMMPYDSRLDQFTRWYQQLSAESLGKSGKGLTPIRALGPVDQHSQLQLFLDGPKDKLFTLIREQEAPSEQTVSSVLASAYEFDYMAGRGIGDVVTAMAKATRDTLLQNGMPVREIVVPNISEEVLGELMMHFMLETVLLADLLGVNPFDQPAVEQGKALTREYLAKG